MWISTLLLSINLLGIHALPHNSTSWSNGTACQQMVVDSHIPHDGYQLHYRLEGCVNDASPVLVFSNGVDCDIRMWDATIPHLKKRFPDFRILRYDSRGYRAEGIDKPLNLSILSHDIEALLDALHIHKAHAVIGSSLGGSTAMTFAIQYPDRLEKFIASDILIDPTKANSTTVDPRVTFAKTYGMAAIAPQLVAADFTPQAVNSSEWNKAITMISEANADGMGAVSNLDNSFYNIVNVKDLPRHPGLYVVGADDVRCVSFMTDFVAANPPNAGLRTIEGSHLCMMENGSGWVDAVEGFLRA